MPTITCNIKNIDPILEYKKSGRVDPYYWGTLYLSSPVSFSFRILAQKILFTPSAIDELIKESIVRAVISHVEKNDPANKL